MIPLKEISIELLRKRLDGEGVFDVLDLYGTSLVDEPLEVVRGRTAVLSWTEEEGEALATRGVCLTSPLWQKVKRHSQDSWLSAPPSS